LQPCTVAPYAAVHVEAVSLIDKQCFIDPWLKRSFIEELNAPCSLNLVATAPDDDTQALGYCLSRVIADRCTVSRLAVHPDFQRQGIATYLLEACLLQAGCEGACNCFIDVRAGNTTALRFYEKQGFRRIGRRKAYYLADTEDAIRMRLIIDSTTQTQSVT
jgi:ribosomal-protein-alanine N-acetyltransferase